MIKEIMAFSSFSRRFVVYGHNDWRFARVALNNRLLGSEIRFRQTSYNFEAVYGQWIDW